VGIQVAQLVALIDWLPEKDISITASGPVSGVVTLMAAALSERSIVQIQLYDSLTNFSQLFEQPSQYDETPSLFCFGLLKAFDIADLKALTDPTPVMLVQ
jgi:hypothetical protein